MVFDFAFFVEYEGAPSRSVFILRILLPISTCVPPNTVLLTTICALPVSLSCCSRSYLSCVSCRVASSSATRVLLPWCGFRCGFFRMLIEEVSSLITSSSSLTFVSKFLLSVSVVHEDAGWCRLPQRFLLLPANLVRQLYSNVASARRR